MHTRHSSKADQEGGAHNVGLINFTTCRYSRSKKSGGMENVGSYVYFVLYAEAK